MATILFTLTETINVDDGQPTAGYSYEIISSTDALSLTIYRQMEVNDSATLTDILSSHCTLNNIVIETINISDTLQRVIKELRQETINIAPTLLEILISKSSSITESISIQSNISTLLNTTVSLSETLGLTDVLANLDALVISETITASSALSFLAVIVEERIESITLSESLNNTLVINFLLSDNTLVIDDISTHVTFNTLIQDSILTFGSIVIDDEHYTFTLNTKTKGVTEYDNYNFNSMSDGLGATSSGIYNLEGSTDGGENINGSIKTALMQFGTNQEKQVPYAYLGLNKSGAMMLKTIVGYRGDRKERWYAVTDRTISATNQVRIQMGKGVKSRYWQFELINKEGSDFELNNFKLMPLILKRRV